MKKTINQIYKATPTWLKNRYTLSAIIFAIWIFFFDNNSITVQVNQQKEIKKIHEDIEYYKKEIQKDKELINILSTDTLTQSFEKYLREVLLLSKKDEEIFIIK